MNAFIFQIGTDNRDTAWASCAPAVVAGERFLKTFRAQNARNGDGAAARRPGDVSRPACGSTRPKGA